MKRVDLGEPIIATADEPGPLTKSERELLERGGATPKSEVFVYVLDMTLAHEYGWISVHRTYESAVAKLESRVREYGLWDEYRAVLARDYVAHSNAGPVAAGEEDDVVHWGISHLPVEP